MGKESLALDLRGETFEQRFKRMPERLTRYDLVKLRLFYSVTAVNFAIKRNKIPYIKDKGKYHFIKSDIKKWLKDGGNE